MKKIKKTMVAVLKKDNRGGEMKKYLIALIFLISLSFGSTSALPINETVKNFQFIFEAINDTNLIGKMWDNEGQFFDRMLCEADYPLQDNELVSAVGVLTGNNSDLYNTWGACAVVSLKNPENASNIEEFAAENNKTYVRVYDRTIDGHKALLIKTGDNSTDPLMEYEALYWLDEVNGKATKLVFVLSQWPEKETERLMDTIHVEEKII